MLDWIENALADSARYPRLNDGASAPFRVVMPHTAQVGSADDCRPDISMLEATLAAIIQKVPYRRRQRDSVPRAPRRAAGQRGCLPRTRTPQAANMPPFPSTTLISGPSTCAAASPLTWRTDSWMANIPYIPVWAYESPPPLVFIGSEPPGSAFPSPMNAPASPLGTKPHHSS